MSAHGPPEVTPAGRPPTPAPTQIPQYAYGWLVYVVGALAAILLAFAIYKLNYSFGQAPHRIVKILLGVGIVLLVILRPRIAIFAWFLSLPISGWMPSTGITGLNGANVLFLALVISWAVPALMRKERLFGRTPLRWPIAAHIGVLGMTGLVTVMFLPGGSSQSAYGVFFYLWQRIPAVAVYFVVANMGLDEKQIKNLLATLAVGAGALGLIALQQFSGVGEAGRVRGGMNSNELGAYFSICGTMLLAQIVSSRVFGFFRTVVIWIGAALASMGVLLSKSRGAYVSFAASLGTMTYLTSKKAFIVFLIVLATSPVWAPGFVKDRVAETRSDSVEAVLVGDPTDRLDPAAGVRLEIWKIVIKEFVRSPIFGHGHASVPTMTAGKLSRPFSAHSLYMETLSDSGLIGLGVLLWLLAACVRRGRELLRLADDAFFRGLAIGFLSVTVAVIVANIFGQRFASRAITGTFFVLAGLVDRGIGLKREAAAVRSIKEVPAS